VAVDHMEEPATSQTVGVPPLKDRPAPAAPNRSRITAPSNDC